MSGIKDESNVSQMLWPSIGTTDSLTLLLSLVQSALASRHPWQEYRLRNSLIFLFGNLPILTGHQISVTVKLYRHFLYVVSFDFLPQLIITRGIGLLAAISDELYYAHHD